MNILRFQSAYWRVVVVASALFCVAIPAARVVAQVDKPAPAADKAAGEKTPAADKPALPPLPAEAHAQQSMQIDGKTLKYTVTVGALPVRDKDGKIAGDVVVTCVHGGGRKPAGHVCVERRAGRVERVSEFWRDRAEALEGGQ